jgi:hypothetical protein
MYALNGKKTVLSGGVAQLSIHSLQGTANESDFSQQRMATKFGLTDVPYTDSLGM